MKKILESRGTEENRTIKKEFNKPHYLQQKHFVLLRPTLISVSSSGLLLNFLYHLDMNNLSIEYNPNFFIGLCRLR